MVKKTKKVIPGKTKKPTASAARKIYVDKTKIVKKCIKLVEIFSDDDKAFAKILHPKVESTVFPNLFALKIHIRKLEEMKAGLAMGRKTLKSQQFKIKKLFETKDAVTAEVLWTGEMAVDAGSLKKGQLLTAHCCFVFEFKDGLIFRQRNYDCYEPFEHDPAHLVKNYEKIPGNKPFLPRK